MAQIELIRVQGAAIYTDYDTGARLNCAIYMPDFLADDGNISDTVYFGFAARRLPTGHDGHNRIDDPAVKRYAPEMWVARALREEEWIGRDEPDMFCTMDEPTEQDLLWSDHDSGGHQDIKVYLPRPSKSGYVPIGVYVEVSKAPTVFSNYAQNFRCIREDLVTEGRLGISRRFGRPGSAWDDQGSDDRNSGAKWPHVAYWDVKADGGGFATGTMAASNGGDLNGAETSGRASPPPRVIRPGAYQFGMPHAKWMQDKAARFPNIKLTDFCLPASHDTGTYSLIDKFGEDRSNFLKNSFGHAMTLMRNMIESAKDKGLEGLLMGTDAYRAMIGQVINGSTAQSRTMAGQLADGIRVFDLRAYCYQGGFYIGHGLLGDDFFDVFYELIEFLDGPGSEEVAIVCLGHWTNFEVQDYENFANQLIQACSYLCYRPSDAKSQNGKNQPSLEGLNYSSITNSGRRLILTWAMEPKPNSHKEDDRHQRDFLKSIKEGSYGKTWAEVLSEYFWPSSFSPPSSSVGGMKTAQDYSNYMAGTPTPGVFGAYTKTTNVTKALTQQKERWQWLANSEFHGTPLAIYITLTPSDADTILRVVLAGAKHATEPLSTLLENLIKELPGVDQARNEIQGWSTLKQLAARFQPSDVMNTLNVMSVTEKKKPFMVFADFYQDIYDDSNSLVQTCKDISHP